jgi:uncharacterized RDD family membrane protein YckC
VLQVATGVTSYGTGMELLAENIWRLDAATVVQGQLVNGQLRARQIAGIGSRLAAGLFDTALQFIIGFGFFALQKMSIKEYQPERSPWLYLGIILEWHVVYMMLFEAFSWGSTPGKYLLGIIVVDKRTGASLRPDRSVVRNLLRIVDWLPALYLTAATSGLATACRQRLGDLVSHAIVVYRDPINTQLSNAGVPESIYSTSGDGYLLEAAAERLRGPNLANSAIMASAVATYLHRKYPPNNAELDSLYSSGNHAAYLERRLQSELAADRAT